MRPRSRRSRWSLRCPSSLIGRTAGRRVWGVPRRMRRRSRTSWRMAPILGMRGTRNLMRVRPRRTVTITAVGRRRRRSFSSHWASVPRRWKGRRWRGTMSPCRRGRRRPRSTTVIAAALGMRRRRHRRRRRPPPITVPSFFFGHSNFKCS